MTAPRPLNDQHTPARANYPGENLTARRPPARGNEIFLSVPRDERYKENERTILPTRAHKRRLANLRQRLTLNRHDVETDHLA